MEQTKKLSILDYISYLTDKKIPWEDLSDVNKKGLLPFILNRWLSMDIEYIELVNDLQKYTIGNMSNREVYKLYFDVLPKRKRFNKYIKSKKAQKYNPDLVLLLSQHFLCSRKEATEYLDILYKERLNTVIEIIKLYGKTDKEIRNLIKLEKE